jgi:hypothetical protein
MQLGILEVVYSEKGDKQAIVLAVGRKCTKHWGTKGIASGALQTLAGQQTR